MATRATTSKTTAAETPKTEENADASVRRHPPTWHPPTYKRTPDRPGLSDEQVQVLARPLSRKRVTNRTEQGKQLSYLQAWDVKATLVRVFGFAGFSAELLDTRILYQGEKAQTSNPNKMNAVVVAQATVRLTIHATGAVYTETATGQNAQPDVGKAFDTALKSAESDALKRAAVYLGTQFGLSLYGKTTDDVCRPVIETSQAAAIAALRVEQAAEDAATAAALDRATTKENVAGAEDADAEDASLAAPDTGEGGAGGEQS